MNSYEILGKLGEGVPFFLVVRFDTRDMLGAYGVVLKCRHKVSIELEAGA